MKGTAEIAAEIAPAMRLPAIEIHKGNTDGTFTTASEGGAALTPGSVAGEGGRLAAINPRTLDILTTAPIGLSLLQRQSGTLTYALKTIYNIGPGRTSSALVDFHGTGNLDLALDSAEGVAIITGNSDGTFQTSNAYSSLAPGLGATVGRFRNNTNNPTGIADVVGATGAAQAQLLKGKGGECNVHRDDYAVAGGQLQATEVESQPVTITVPI